MTPKEKAKELLNKYYGITDVNFGTRQQKQCSLIAVQEIIENNEKLGKKMYYDLGTDSYSSRCLNQDNKFFWLEVKSEIEKL